MLISFFVSLIFVTAQILAGGENLLRGKTVKASDYQKYAKNIADGDRDSCMWLRPDKVLFVVFDLGKVHQIDKLVMYNGYYRSDTPFSVYIGDEFKTCHFETQIKNWRLCKSGILQDKDEIEIPCEHELPQARYLAVVKGSFDAKEITGELNFCELELHGVEKSDSPELKRPVITKKAIKPVSREDFPLVDILRKDVPTITLKGFTKGFRKLNKFCTPIIWDSTWNLTFALACETEDKKARGTFFGLQWYFWYLKDNPAEKPLQDALLKWLSPNRNINIKGLIESKKLRSAEAVYALDEGEIIDFNGEEPHSEAVLEALIKQISSGKLSLMLDMSVQNRDIPDLRKAMEKVMEIFGVGFDNTFFTYGSTGTYTIKDSDFTEELLDLEDRLERYLDDPDSLTRYANTLNEAIAKLPQSLLKKKDLKHIYLEYIKKYDDLLTFICPCKADPAVDPNDRQLILLLSRLFEGQSLANSGYKLPCLNIYPGDFKTDPAISSATLEIFGEIAKTRNPTGYYLQAGKTLNYEIESSEGDWMMSVGCQSDFLGDARLEWSRYPDLYVDNVELSGKGTVYSPYGGALWITNSKANSKLRIKLSGVVATPLFNIHDPNAIADWDEKQRHNPGLWAQIAGEDLVICEQSAFLKDFSGEYMERLMRRWDKMIRGIYALAGEDWRVHRPEQTELDIQTSFGYGHSGYPVVAWDDWFVNIFNETYISTKGSWGMCHEHGHNRQSNQYTFSAVTEATNNIYCLMSFPKIWNLPMYGSSLDVLKNEGDDKAIIKFLENGAIYQDFVDSTTVEKMMYAHLANSFGLEFYHEVFSYYTKHPEIAPKTDEAIIDMWIKIGSDVTGMNLVPIHEFWGLPIGDSIREELNHLPCFIPDDYVTNMAPTRTKTIVDKYPNCLRKSTYFKDFDIDQYVQGHRPNFITKIEG